MREAGMLTALLRARDQAADSAELHGALDSTWAALLVLSQCRLPAREHEAIVSAAAEQVRPLTPF